MNRIPLTDEDIKIYVTLTGERDYLKIYHDTEGLQQLKKQILDDYEFFTSCDSAHLMLDDFRNIKELKVKAEKYDNVTFIFQQYEGGLHKFVNDFFTGQYEPIKKLEQENKQLSEIVQKVREWKAQEDDAIAMFEGTHLQTQELSVHQFRKRLSKHLKEILGGKND